MALKLPPFYHLPPFFTLQPVIATREKQTKLWTDLILAYCNHNKIYKINVDEAEKLPIFHNDTINHAIVELKRGSWSDPKRKDVIEIYWRTPSEWADIIQKWATDNGYNNSVCTVYELIEGDTGEGTEFYGLDGDLFRKAIQVMQRRGKAELFQGTTSDEDGVKFMC